MYHCLFLTYSILHMLARQPKIMFTHEVSNSLHQVSNFLHQVSNDFQLTCMYKRGFDGHQSSCKNFQTIVVFKEQTSTIHTIKEHVQKWKDLTGSLLCKVALSKETTTLFKHTNSNQVQETSTTSPNDCMNNNSLESKICLCMQKQH